MDINIGTIITAVITGIFSLKIGSIIEIYRRRKLGKILNLVEVKKVFEDSDFDSYKKDFINNDIKENYFYTRTGIETNSESISDYIIFKNKLKKNYNWQSIKNIKPYLKFDKNNVIFVDLNPNKLGDFSRKIEFLFLVLMIISIIIILSLIPKVINLFNFKEQIIIFSSLLFPIIIVRYLFKNIFDYTTAKQIKKNLKTHEKRHSNS